MNKTQQRGRERLLPVAGKDLAVVKGAGDDASRKQHVDNPGQNADEGRRAVGAEAS